MDLILWDICAFYRENEEPNQQIANTLLKEIQEVEQIKNDVMWEIQSYLTIRKSVSMVKRFSGRNGS